MQHALVMLVLPLRRYSSAIRMTQAEFKSRGRIGGDLHADGPGEDRMEDERVGRDPADEPAPKLRSRTHRHAHRPPRSLRLTQPVSSKQTRQHVGLHLHLDKSANGHA